MAIISLKQSFLFLINIVENLENQLGKDKIWLIPPVM